MMTDKQLFGLRVKHLRESKKWTQEYLSGKIEINSKYLSSIERGKENPTFDMLEKISQGLQVEMWELFDYKNEVNKKELRKMLTGMIKEIDEEKIKLVVKVLKAIIK